jgi:methylenetetrahydrofolate--tRNA-(uracil-5-)-methyltransferase
VPETTAHGALIRHITESESRHFQPSNINFGLFPLPENALKMRDKKLKKQFIVERAMKDWENYLNELGTL